MKSKLSLIAGLSILGLALGAGVGQAQLAPINRPGPQNGPPPPVITSAVHAQSTANSTSSSGHSSGTNGLTAAAGWNYFHATNCAPYYDGSTTWVYVFPAEGGYWYTSNSIFETSMLTQCAVGNWMAVYVTNTTTGYFPEIYTFAYK